MVRFLLFFILLFLFNGCFYDNKPLKVGISPWIGYEGIYQAKEFGWIDDNIELVEGNLASDTFKKLLSGQVDAAPITIDDFLVARSKGIDLKIIAVLDISSGSDVILSKNKINDLSEIKGKRIAMDNTVLGSLMLTKMLEKADLHLQDITVSYIPPNTQHEAWDKNQIDMAITYEPYAARLYNKAGHYVLSTHDFPEMIFDVLVVRADRIKGREATIQNLVEGHFKSLEYLHTNYQDMVYRIASREKITPNDVIRTLGGVVLPSQAANLSYLSDDSHLHHAMSDLNELMTSNHFIPQKVSMLELYDSSYVKELR